MVKKKPETENLPVLLSSIPAGYQTFDLSKVENEHANEQLDPEVEAMYSEEDSEGYANVPKELPWVSIRQIPPTDDKGKLVGDAGGFEMKNKLGSLFDVDGTKGLYVSVLLVEAPQTRWREGVEKPICKAPKGIIGEGDPGGECRKCKFSQFIYNEETKKKDRPDCGKAFHLLCMDLTQPGSFFNFVTSRSGLRPWGNFATWAGTQVIRVAGKSFTRPIHSYNIHITTEYIPKQDEKAAYWIPRFVVVGSLDKDFAGRVMKVLPDFRGRFISDVAAIEHREGGNNNDSAKYSELPEGATPVEPPASESSGDGTLPF